MGNCPTSPSGSQVLPSSLGRAGRAPQRGHRRGGEVVAAAAARSDDALLGGRVEEGDEERLKVVNGGFHMVNDG